MIRRTVVTGLGPVTPIGVGRDAFWNAVVAGVDGSGEVRRFDTSMYKVHRACEVKDLVAPRLAGDPGPASILAAAATRLAIEDAGLDAPPPEAGLVIGTTGGEIPVLEAMHRSPPLPAMTRGREAVSRSTPVTGSPRRSRVTSG